MKNTFRELRPSEILFVLINGEIKEFKVRAISENKMNIYSVDSVSSGKSFDWWILSESFDNNYETRTFDNAVICANEDIAKMFKYKYHRLEVYKSMQKVNEEMNQAMHHLNQTKNIMNDLVNDEESIDWNNLEK